MCILTFKFKLIHYPSSPMQPGPIYFLIPRKCGIFGVYCAAIPQQVNFLIDETFDTGKGANAVISMVHYYLENHGLHAVILHFNADNCTGQNKNNAVIQVHMYNYVVHVPLSVYVCVPKGPFTLHKLATGSAYKPMVPFA